MTQPELSRPIRADRIGRTPRMLDVEATAEERAALAQRFGLLALDRLVATASLEQTEADILATGRVEADLAQACVATGAAVPARIDEPFAIRFRPPPSPSHDEEVELGEEELEVMFIEGAMIDLGEAVAQTLALALDPYPRTPEAADALKDAGVKSEGEAGPFGALAALKEKLSR